MIIRFHFHRHTSIFAKLIRWRTGSDINHTSVEYNGKFYDANTGRRLQAFDKPDVGIVDTVSIWIPEHRKNDVEKFLEETLGSKYDYLAIWNFITNKLNQDKKRWFCSEHSFKVFQLAIGDITQPKKLVTPEQMRLACKYYSLGINHS